MHLNSIAQFTYTIDDVSELIRIQSLRVSVFQHITDNTDLSVLKET